MRRQGRSLSQAFSSKTLAAEWALELETAIDKGQVPIVRLGREPSREGRHGRAAHRHRQHRLAVLQFVGNIGERRRSAGIIRAVCLSNRSSR